MRTFLQKTTGILLVLLLGSCTFPGSGQSIPDAVPAKTTIEPPQDYQQIECALMWAKDPLPELSKNLNHTLKESLPNAEGYAEAYGENCVAETGEVVRFLAMETDYYVTLEVENLDDKQALGELIERVIEALADFPTEETPGPQPAHPFFRPSFSSNETHPN